jgi:3,4-dihydroxy 2-butanone 4-phosphate synthase/GTP cyclohydrolase II
LQRRSHQLHGPEARGLICLTLTDEHCQRLGLEQMVPSNGSVFSTAFTVSIEAAVGVTTGISAADRARTVAAAVAQGASAADIVQPGTSSRCAPGKAAC